MRRLAIAGVLCMVGAAMPVSASPLAVDKSDNVKRVANFEFGATPELAFQGRYAYALTQSEIFIIDRKRLKVISSFKCSVGDIGAGTEIESVKRGWIAFDAYGCEGQRGVFFLNVRDPKNPRLGGVVPDAFVHTMTAYPRKPTFTCRPTGLPVISPAASSN